MEQGLGPIIGGIFSIIIIDLALSGDNAAVIGLAIKDLPPTEKKKAAFLGAGGAIILRVIFTILATLLLQVKYINAVGGVLLLWITWKLVRGGKGEEGHVEGRNRFWSAVGTIIIADLSMAFDNVMGVAGAAHGNISLLIFGLVLSIPILILGSNFLSNWMNKQPFVIFVAAAVLVHTSLVMIFRDRGLTIDQYLGPTLETAIPWIVALTFLLWGWFEANKIKKGTDLR